MADISQLGALNPVEPLDLDNYQDNKDFTPLPSAGEYMVQAPTFSAASFGRTKAGALSVQIDPTIVDTPSAGYQIRFTKVSAKPFKRNGVTVSQLGDYLRAAGVSGRMTSEQDLADAAEMTSGRTYRVQVDWRAYNKNTKYSLEGMTRFPSDGKGGYLPWTEDPNEQDPETGQPRRLRANLVITRFIPAE